MAKDAITTYRDGEVWLEGDMLVFTDKEGEHRFSLDDINSITRNASNFLVKKEARGAYSIMTKKRLRGYLIPAPANPDRMDELAQHVKERSKSTPASKEERERVVRRTDTGAVLCDDLWYSSHGGRWKALFDTEKGPKPGLQEMKMANALIDGKSDRIRVVSAGERLEKAIKEHGSLEAAERALIENGLPIEGEKIGSYFQPPAAELEQGMLTVRGRSENRWTRPYVSVPIASVTGVTVLRNSFIHGTLVLQGQGTELGRVDGFVDKAEEVATWIRERLIATDAPQAKSSEQPRDVTGELERLARLRESGVLDQSEFDALKAKLLSTY